MANYQVEESCKAALETTIRESLTKLNSEGLLDKVDADVDVKVGFHERIDVDVVVKVKSKDDTITNRKEILVTKEELKAFLTKVANVARTLATFVPQLGVVAAAVEAIVNSDLMLTALLWLINRYFTSFNADALNAATEEDICEGFVHAFAKSSDCDDEQKAAMLSALPKLKESVKSNREAGAKATK